MDWLGNSSAEKDLRALAGQQAEGEPALACGREGGK